MKCVVPPIFDPATDIFFAKEFYPDNEGDLAVVYFINCDF